jgi:flagellum-specific peptidoglycan hydrolase FlgJ
MKEMKLYGVPASITLAQGILETNAGKSELVKSSNNHFGIKCHDSWTGDSVSYDDDAKGNVLENIEARSPRIEIILNFSPRDLAIQAFLN